VGVAGGEGGRGRKGGASGHRSLVVTLKQGALLHVSTKGPFITDSCSLLGITYVPFLLECQRPAQEPGFFYMAVWVHVACPHTGAAQHCSLVCGPGCVRSMGGPPAVPGVCSAVCVQEHAASRGP
jgi:hypothetical protein